MTPLLYGGKKNPAPQLDEEENSVDLRWHTDIEEMVFQPLEIQLLDTHWSFKIPYGSVGFICSLRGLSLSQGLVVLGTPLIPAGYQGAVRVPLINLSPRTQRVIQGERIAKLLFLRQAAPFCLKHEED
jgi:dUTPase